MMPRGDDRAVHAAIQPHSRLRADGQARGKNAMKRFLPAHAFGAALIAAIAASTASRADVKDYEFQLVNETAKKGPDAIIAVRLVHKPSRKLVPDAVIFTTRLDMAPDAMPEMTTPLEPLPSAEPGVYRFKTEFSMEGRWALSLAAKVQGETGTVQTKLIVKAVP
jgi:YtkA-like